MQTKQALEKLVQIRDSVSSMKPFEGRGVVLSSLNQMVKQVTQLLLPAKTIALLVAEAEKHYKDAEQKYCKKYGAA